MTEDRGTLVASYVAPEEAGSGRLASGTEHAPAPATVQMAGGTNPDHLTDRPWLTMARRHAGSGSGHSTPSACSLGLVRRTARCPL